MIELHFFKRKRERERERERERDRQREKRRLERGSESKEREEGYPGTNYSDMLDTRGLVKLRSFNDCVEFRRKGIEYVHRRIIVVFFPLYHFCICV